VEIPGYTIVRKLGEGHMATVYLATQGRLNRHVALKILNPALATNDRFTERFIHEGRVIDLLRHPQIVPLFEFNFYEGYYYFSMEFLPGGTLAQYIQQGLIPERALAITRLIAEALAYAHQRGVIHRDLKPQNILFRQDHTPVLTDFGIAKVMDASSTLTIKQAMMGSPRYISPEQAAGKPLDARSDIYSLGAIFYEMLTQHHPYPASDVVDLLTMQDTLPELPNDLAQFQPVLNKMLAKKPNDRFDSADHLIQALEQIQTDQFSRIHDVIDLPVDIHASDQPIPYSELIADPVSTTHHHAQNSGRSNASSAVIEPEKPGSARAKTIWVISSSLLLVMAATTGAYLTFLRPSPVEPGSLQEPPSSDRPIRPDQAISEPGDRNRIDDNAAQRQAQDIARRQAIEERLHRGIEEEVKRQAIEAERLRKIEEDTKRQAIEAERLRKIEEDAKRQAIETERLRKIEEDAKRQTAKPAPSPTPAVVKSKAPEPARVPTTSETKSKAVAKTDPIKTQQNRRCGNILSRITLGEPVSNEDRAFITKECR